MNNLAESLKQKMRADQLRSRLSIALNPMLSVQEQKSWLRGIIEQCNDWSDPSIRAIAREASDALANVTSKENLAKKNLRWKDE